MPSIDFISAYENNSLWEKIALTEIAGEEYVYSDWSLLLNHLFKKIESCWEAKTVESFYEFKKVYQVYYYILNFKQHVCPKAKFGRLSVLLDKLWNEYLGAAASKAYLRELRKKSLREDIANLYSELFLGTGWHAEKKQKLAEKIEALEKEFKANARKSNAFYVFSLQDKLTYLSNFKATTLQKAKKRAESRKLEGYLFSFENDQIRILLANIENREKRQEIYEAFLESSKNCEYLAENEKILNKILALKKELSQLYGHDNYAELVLSRYLLTKNQTEAFLTESYSQMSVILSESRGEMEKMFKADGFEGCIQVWDYPYYHRKFKAAHVKGLTLSEYFTYEKSFPKIMRDIGALFSLNISWKGAANGSDVYEIQDAKSQRKAYWIISPFIRSKAETNPYELDLCSHTKQSRGYTPSAQFIHLRLPKNGKMSYVNVQNSVHEIGHALHSFFKKQEILKDSDTMGYDLVELPSQFLEQLSYDYAFVKRWATKFLSKKLFDKVVKEQKFNGIFYMEESLINFMAFFDMNYAARAYSNKRLLQRIVSQRHSIGEFYHPGKEPVYFNKDHKYEYFGNYVYFFSENIARALFRATAYQDYRKVYVLFAGSIAALKAFLSQHVDFSEIDMFDFFEY